MSSTPDLAEEMKDNSPMTSQNLDNIEDVDDKSPANDLLSQSTISLPPTLVENMIFINEKAEMPETISQCVHLNDSEDLLDATANSLSCEEETLPSDSNESNDSILVPATQLSTCSTEIESEEGTQNVIPQTPRHDRTITVSSEDHSVSLVIAAGTPPSTREPPVGRSSKKMLQTSSHLLDTPKAVEGLKELMKTPENSNFEGVQELLKTPAIPPKSPRLDRSGVAGVEVDEDELPATPPVSSKTPKADYSQVEGVAELLKTPAQPPKTLAMDSSVVEGVGELFKTPAHPSKTPKTDRSRDELAETPAKADYSEVEGVAELLKTPAHPSKTPRKDTSDVEDTDEFPVSPDVATKTPKTANDDYSYVEGVGDLLKTPAHPPKTPKSVDLEEEEVDEPLENTISLEGVQELVATPAAAPQTRKTRQSAAVDVKGAEENPEINERTRTRPARATPASAKADYRDVSGIKRLLRTPKVSAAATIAETPKFQGVARLFETPEKSTSEGNAIDPNGNVKRKSVVDPVVKEEEEKELEPGESDEKKAESKNSKKTPSRTRQGQKSVITPAEAEPEVIQEEAEKITQVLSDIAMTEVTEESPTLTQSESPESSEMQADVDSDETEKKKVNPRTKRARKAAPIVSSRAKRVKKAEAAPTEELPAETEEAEELSEIKEPARSRRTRKTETATTATTAVRSRRGKAVEAAPAPPLQENDEAEDEIQQSSLPVLRLTRCKVSLEGAVTLPEEKAKTPAKTRARPKKGKAAESSSSSSSQSLEDTGRFYLIRQIPRIATILRFNYN